MSRQKLEGLENVVSIRPGVDERTTLQDFEEHLNSMERILEGFDGREPEANVHTGRYLLREALKHTPIIAAAIPDTMKDRLAKLYQDLGALDQQFQGKSVAQVLEEDPALAAYLREHGFGPENI
ncbi:hypothetical protein ACI77O_12445 [Pseudomonas tritici]|uniref:hypothetical protein n=1 Tax=Pseudomonas tritici TaxID=2745518 RepID=UPI00387B28BA